MINGGSAAQPPRHQRLEKAMLPTNEAIFPMSVADLNNRIVTWS